MTNSCESSLQYLDLRGTPCPLNYIRSCLIMEGLEKDQVLKIDLDIGEPEKMVLSGLKSKGYDVKVLYHGKEFLTIVVSLVES